MNDIMIDLETLDTATTAVVLSIGAVVFDRHSTLTGEKFYVELTNDLDFQMRVGRTISPSTVLWWMQQSDQSKRVFAPTGAHPSVRQDTHTALQGFCDYVTKFGGSNVHLWGNGSDFDNAILSSLYKSVGLRQPWDYSKNRCYRTMKNLGLTKSTSHLGVPHNALDDAITQAARLQEIFACIKAP